MNRVKVIKGDITKLKVSAIVNAANNSLLGGGGIDGAIHKAAGPELLSECKTLNGCRTGKAKITSAYKLPSKYIIHTVGPIWHDGNNHESDQLKNCYINSLDIVLTKKDITSIAFPAISCGIYGYPTEQATQIAIDCVTTFLEEQPTLNLDVTFICFDDKIFKIYQKLLSI